MVGTGQDPGAARFAVDDLRSAVPADIVEGPRLTVVAADKDDAGPEIVELLPLAGLGDVARVAQDLRAGAEERALLRLEEIGIAIGPAGKAEIRLRIFGRGGDGHGRGYGGTMPPGRT